MKARNVKPGMLVEHNGGWHVVLDHSDATAGAGRWRRFTCPGDRGVTFGLDDDVKTARLSDAQRFDLRLVGTGTVTLTGTRFVDEPHWQPLRAQPIQQLRVYGLVDLDGEEGAMRRPVVLTAAGRTLLDLLNAKETADA